VSYLKNNIIIFEPEIYTNNSKGISIPYDFFYNQILIELSDPIIYSKNNTFFKNYSLNFKSGYELISKYFSLYFKKILKTLINDEIVIELNNSYISFMDVSFEPYKINSNYFEFHKLIKFGYFHKKVVTDIDQQKKITKMDWNKNIDNYYKSQIKTYVEKVIIGDNNEELSVFAFHHKQT
jgi:hypothetical protein